MVESDMQSRIRYHVYVSRKIVGILKIFIKTATMHISMYYNENGEYFIKYYTYKLYIIITCTLRVCLARNVNFTCVKFIRVTLLFFFIIIIKTRDRGSSDHWSNNDLNNYYIVTL